MWPNTYSTLLSSLIFLQIFSSAISHLPPRFLESIDSFSSNPLIEIAIKAEDSDYRIFSFIDPTMFYCEKVMDPLGVNDICSLKPSQFSLSKPLLMSNLSSLIYPVGNHFFFFGQNVMYIYGLQTNFEHLRAQMITAISLIPQGSPGRIDNVFFDSANQLVIAIQGSKLTVYALSGMVLEIRTEAVDPIIETVDFQDKQLYYFGNRYLVYFDRANSDFSLYMVNIDRTLTLQTRIEQCQEVFVDSQYVLVFTGNKIKALNGKEDLAADFPYQVKSIVRAASTGIFVYAQDDDQEEATIFHVEYFEKKGFRLPPILTCPKNAKRIHFTSANLYVVYDSWFRVYPAVKEMEYSHDFYFDTIMTNKLFGVMESDERSFLVVRAKDRDMELYEVSRSGFGLECKKEKGTTVVEYNFQVKCLSTKCENADFSTRKFANGSCEYTRTTRIYPEEEGGALGIALLVTLGFIAGIAITIGLGVMHCFSKKTEQTTTRPRSPKDKKMININRGLRRNHTTGNVENRKFLGEGDDTYTSEELRDAMLNSSHKKKPQTLFETPRFVSYGVGSHGAHGSHGNHIAYVNIDSKDQTNEMGDLMIGSGVLNEEESEDRRQENEGEKGKGKVEIGKLQIGEGKSLGKDLVSFRKDLASFRDPTMGSHGTQEEKDHKEEKKEEYKGKYQEFKDEVDDEEDDLGLGDEEYEENQEGEEKDGQGESATN